MRRHADLGADVSRRGHGPHAGDEIQLLAGGNGTGPSGTDRARSRPRSRAGAVCQYGIAIFSNRPTCFTEGRMRYIQERSLAPRGAVNGEPESCSA